MRNNALQKKMSVNGNTQKLFTTHTLILSAVGLFINLFFANLVIFFKLPLYIDNVGSVFVGALAGPIPGMTVGFLSNYINAFGDPITMYYGILTIIMAYLASVYSQKGFFNSKKGFFIIVGTFIIIGGGLGSVMTWLLYGGGIGGIGAPFAHGLNNAGFPAIFSQIIVDIIIDIPDKTITTLIVCILLHALPTKIYEYFPLGHFYKGEYEQEPNLSENTFKKSSVQTKILRLIISCSLCISFASFVVSFKMYCSLESDYNNRLIYLIQFVSVAFALTILISSFTIWFASEHISLPISRIIKLSREFRSVASEEWLENDLWKQRESVNTGDEIEELYFSICKGQETVSKNVKIMKENEEKLRHSKELEDALENAKHASKAKGAFLSRMSHEIRTPLNAIIGYLQIAKISDNNPEKVMHCINNGELAAKHLLSLINDVLDVSAIENGKMKIAHEPFNLKDQIQTLSSIFYNQAKVKKIHFETFVRNLTIENVIGDSLRINQILMNLLSNAVKFTDEGGNVTLSVEEMQQIDKNVFLKFEVKDNGIGMSKEYQKKLFTPFEQESATTAQKYGGSGLGLSITGNLLSMMNGAVNVVSEQGIGSTFIVSLPLMIQPDAEVVVLTNTHKHHALIVDDNVESAENIKAVLKECKVKSDIVDSEKDAQKKVKNRLEGAYAYDFCIINADSDSINKTSLLKTIKEVCGTKKIYFIFASYQADSIPDEIMNDKDCSVIVKPIFQSNFIQLLEHVHKNNNDFSNHKSANRDLTGIHILLAEDNEMNSEIATEILSKAGMNITPVFDGKQAFEKFRDSKPKTYQAILMDVQMPIMDGYESTKNIRNLGHPDAKNIPIIAMTANAFKEDVSAALTAGMNDHISKPVNYDKLYEILNKYISS